MSFSKNVKIVKIMFCIWGKIIFFSYHNFKKKGYTKLSKDEPENIS